MRIPNAIARWATSFPMRPRPTTPRVLSASSTPVHRLRSQREQQRHGVFGGGQDVRLRRVDHHHATIGGRLRVDVVETDAGPTDDDQIRTCGQHLSGDIGGRADDECVGTDDRL
jgi:hypothetical protein